MSATYSIPRIPYLRLRVTLRAEQPAILPAYQGSMLRGAFGHALRRRVCAMGPEQPCATCLLRRTCPYTRIFETFIDGEPPAFLRGVPSAPRPYAFEPLTAAQELRPGEPLVFDLLLFRQAVDLYGYTLLAIDRMAAGGLGRGRARFAVDRILAASPEGSWQVLVEGNTLRKDAAPRPSLPSPDGPDGSLVRLRFLSPARLVARGRLLETLRFRDLAFLMLRRTLEMAHFHLGEASVDWTFRPYLDRAAAVRIHKADLRWHDWSRYSSRQDAKMTLGGLVGTLDLEGDLSFFAPLLRSAEILHVGKGATFGLGRLEAVPLD